MHAKLFTRSTALAFAASMAMAIGASPAMAQGYPSGGPSSTIDPVTGYQCVDNSCTVVRVRENGPTCLCAKENPAEQHLRNLRLSCQTQENGQWVQCPYRPRYGG